MFCWGNTANGELGLGGIEDEIVITPQEVKFSEAHNVKKISCGKTHTLLVSKDGKVFSCGNNDHGQLGHDKPRTKLQLVDGLVASTMIDVACGENHSLALNEWGQVFTWGSSSLGQLGGQITNEMLTKPKLIKSLATLHVVQIASGYSHCMALTNKGELFVWGSNEFGQLGLGVKTQIIPQPTLVSSLTGLPVAYIACGAYHSFAISKSGAVYGWGKNNFGQLGLNSSFNHVYPCQLKTLRSIRVKYIACGEDFSSFLTQDGGVLTCGAGQSGQLGHGSTSNEILPRKVLELMGSTVTQISCGRRHSLAYITSRRRIYAFGLGGGGQLGSRTLLMAPSPQVVMGPWIDKLSVERIFAGGDRCFVTLLPFEVSLTTENEREASDSGNELSDNEYNKSEGRIRDGEKKTSSKRKRKRKSSPHEKTVKKKLLYRSNQAISDDYRKYPAETQIWCLTLDKMVQCESIGEEDIVDPDLFLYLETVLSSLSCLNASFLLTDDGHYCCTSKHHGVDMEGAVKCFTHISRAQNKSILDLVQNSVNQLILSLVTSPPDVETLRIYIILPLYHEFDNPKNGNSLQGPFANAVLGLKPEAFKIIGNWYYMMSIDYIERLVNIYKNVITLQLRTTPLNHHNMFDLSQCCPLVTSSLDMLSTLNRLNQAKSHLKVSYEKFHMPEIQELVDIRVDYVRWVLDEQKSPMANKHKYLCNYPFIFDAEAKTLLLQTDQTLQMQSAMNEATHQAIAQLLFSPATSVPVTTMLEIHVSRDNLVYDTIRELANCPASDFKKPLKVHFIEEEGEDAGGVKKEFFLLLLREFLDPKYGMFTSDPESNGIWFSETSFEEETMYYLVGLICGLAIYNFTIINLPFPLALYKKLLNEPVDLQDLHSLSPTLARGLQDMLDYKDDDFEEIFCLKFEVTRDVFGEIRTTQLKTNGSEISVNQENKQEYVDLYVDFVLNKSVTRHFIAFKDAFHRVCGGRVLQLFHSFELMAVVIGNENYDWDVFENTAEYRGGYSSSDQTIRIFWEVFHSLTLEDKKKFLVFLTGTDRIPIQGMKAVKIFIQPTLDDKYLPVAHTCFNLLDLPRYSTKERLKYKLLQAIQQTQGFTIV